MKIVNFLYLSILLLCCQTGFSQTIWQGQYNSYRIVVKGDFENTKDSLLLSIPELQYESIKIGVRKDKDSISFKNEMYNFVFKGKYNADKTAVTGVFNNYSIPNAAIVLKKQTEIKPLSTLR